ncbi:MAG: Sec-independent protein translocase protein TatB [Xanthomonadales bacterium]|nr:Sec-independent protein translocase protein TatB [Xanthomonadales bacterium]
MFDVGFSEMLVVGVVALLVLGPERLPKAMRTVGAFIRKARRGFDDLRYEVEREIELEELKKQMQQVPTPSELAQQLVEPLDQARRDLDQAVGGLAQDLRSAAEPPRADDGPRST